MIYTVYYQRFFGLLKPLETRLKTLEFTHRRLKRVEATSLDDVYRQMQSQSWSPQGEARDLIISLHLSHTSLSVGDVVKDARHNVWVCNDLGWLPLRTGQCWPRRRRQAKRPRLWMATEANFQTVPPHITRLKISDERDCLPANAYLVERFGRVAFSDLVALAKLIELRLNLAVCIDLGDEFYETE